jgi:hypothetical protein
MKRGQLVTEKFMKLDEKGNVCNEMKLQRSWFSDRSRRNPDPPLNSLSFKLFSVCQIAAIRALMGINEGHKENRHLTSKINPRSASFSSFAFN